MRDATRNRPGSSPRTHRLLAVLLCLVVAPPATAITLDKPAVEAVSDATYEVVVQKPARDPLSYERPLPLDLLPYSERNDPYYSVGTAFAIAPNRLVSAAHVLNLGHASQLKTVRLRDRHGKLLDIDQVVKYSLRRDFVVFTIKGGMPAATLTPSTAPRLNDKVYAVGNALGEGIVFRDGLYTSDTPEEQDGQWKWMRFSAAASPGNSGGPLLDGEGRVVGIVLRKSENENLNYALPIGEVLKARDNLAELDTKMLYVIDNMDMTYGDRLHKEIALPKPFAALDAELNGELDRFGDRLKDGLFERYRDSIFPNGPGSTRLLYSSYDATLPGVVAKGDDGVWDAFFPNRDRTRTSELGANGSLTYGPLGNSLIVALQKPDDVPLAKLLGDSKLHMDLVLRGLPVQRTVGMERIKVTSLGKAGQDYTYTDDYGRKWIVRMWDLPYSDEKIVLFSLPVPGGFVGMLRAVPTWRIAGHVTDLKVLANFFYLSYYGTLDQWREFLKHRELLPPAFATTRIEFEYGKHFRYASPRVALGYGPEQMRITGRSDLSLRFSYFRENGKAVWDVTDVVVGESKDNATFFSVSRVQRPSPQLDDKFRGKWENIVQRRHPYNRTAFFDERRTLIADVAVPGSGPKDLARAPLLYTVYYGTDGTVEQKVALERLERFRANLDVREY